MATSVTNINSNLVLGAAQGFGEMLFPVSSFSYVVKTGPAALNDTVRVPFVLNDSGSSTFTYTSGYALAGSSITGKTVTLDKLLYQRITLSDSDLVNLNEEAIQRVGAAAGHKLAGDFISASFASCLTQANFPNSGSTLASSFTGSATLAALDKVANDLKWPDGERFILAGSTLWQAFMSNTTINNAANFGTINPVQTGILKQALGFNIVKTSLTLPNGATGVAANPNGLLVANAYHQPTDGGREYDAASEIIDEATGLTIGFRSWYEPILASQIRVFDILGGCAVGDPTGIFWIK